MLANHVNIVLVHGAWADGSSWSKVIGPLTAAGLTVVAAPLPLTSLADDIAAIDRVLERLDGPVVLAGHAYAGGVIAETRRPEGRFAGLRRGARARGRRDRRDVVYHGQPHPKAPELKPDEHGLVWLPEAAFADAFAQNASPQEQAILAAVQRPIDVGLPSASRSSGRCGRTGPSWFLVAEEDRMINPQTQLFHGRADGRPCAAHALSTTRRWSPHPQTS